MAIRITKLCNNTIRIADISRGLKKDARMHRGIILQEPQTLNNGKDVGKMILFDSHMTERMTSGSKFSIILGRPDCVLAEITNVNAAVNKKNMQHWNGLAKQYLDYLKH